MRSKKTLAQLLSDVVLFPQTLVNVRLKPGQDWKNSPELARQTAAVEIELGNTGRILIRASGTEPLLRVMVEHAIQSKPGPVPSALRTRCALKQVFRFASIPDLC